MSDQLPPVDQDLRAHIARRSSGRLPEGLADQVLQAVDAAPVKPAHAWRTFAPRSGLAVPRTMLAAASLAAVLLLAAALAVVPRFQVTPAASGLAGYPADRALTTAELAALMAGPALPANTALVANVVIDVRSDVCPMDRYGTVGILEGMPSQVCVMTASDVLIQPVTIRGIMAFRYLAPGVLGLLGEITPASSAKEAFRVADEWPQGKTFLVEGWLYRLDGSRGYSQVPGAEAMGCPANTPKPAGDPLDPTGSDACIYSWLTDESIAAPPGFASGQPVTSDQARSVESAGMELIDAIPSETAVHGAYVVRAVTEGCPGEPSVSSVGCPAWRVLARVADISLPSPAVTPRPAPTGTPGAPATPLSPSLTGVIGTGNQPLSVDELETLMITQPDHLAGRIVIAKAPIPTQISCQTDANGGGCAVNTAPLAEVGDWAVGIGADGTLSLVGQIATPTTGGYVFTLQQLQAESGGRGTGLAIVDAWLDWENGCDAPSAAPYGSGGCGTSMLTAEKLTWMHMAALLPPGAVVTWVQSDAYRTLGSQDLDSGVHGLYLVEVADQTAPNILGRLEPVTP